MSNKHLKDREETKRKIRKLGKLLTIIGGILTLIGFIDFFSSMGSTNMPTLFVLSFIGLPILGVGIVLLKFGYLKEVSSYVASQTAPVAKDVANYMLDGTREEFSKTVKSVFGKENDNQIKCPNCNSSIDLDAKFCDQCGKELMKKCDKCGGFNDSDSKFCKSCGTRL